MSEFTVSETHEGVSISITVRVAEGARAVAPDAYHLIHAIADGTTAVGIAARNAARSACTPILADHIGSAITEAAVRARTDMRLEISRNHAETVSNAVTAERKKLTEIYEAHLAQRDACAERLNNQVELLQQQLATNAKGAAARGRK
jgi:hypothetical protein